VIVDEAVCGHVPPPWFWALPGIDRIRAFDLSQLPSPPMGRLLGIRAGHVGPGSGTWVMPATGWLSIASGELEVSMLAEAAVTGAAMTTLAPGLDVDPVSLALNYFRPVRPEAGNLLARARVVNASRLFVFVEVEIEDPHGRQVAHGTSHCEVRQVEPSPPPPPSVHRRVEEATYSTRPRDARRARRVSLPASVPAAIRRPVLRADRVPDRGIRRAATGVDDDHARYRAGAGDILVSSTVKDIVVGSSTRLEDRGQHSLKGMPGEWRLFSLVD
jgi:acyl-coenzyme A thioesterase PaaI-like protein